MCTCIHVVLHNTLILQTCMHVALTNTLIAHAILTETEKSLCYLPVEAILICGFIICHSHMKFYIAFVYFTFIGDNCPIPVYGQAGKKGITKSGATVGHFSILSQIPGQMHQ